MKKEFVNELNSILSEAVIDWTRSRLDPRIFDLFNDTYIMRPEVSNFINDVVKSINDNIIDVNNYFVKGSILSFQWLDHSDVDVLVEIDDDIADDERDRLQREVDDAFDNVLIPNTEHPIQIYLNVGEYDPDNADGIYVIDYARRGMSDPWVKGPYNIRVDIDDYMSKFQKVAGSIDIDTGELRRDIIDYELLKKLPYEDINNLEHRINSKLDEINDGVDDLVYQYKHIRDLRHKAFSDELTPQEIIKYGSKNKLPENVIFKMLERYYYLSMLRNLKDLTARDDIDTDNVDDVKEIIKEI
ncbi:MAG: hypothetical protein GF411_14280 [Candidatus Lokiarchaeota archaeon]|nr:hypothetical protein [Candidatus Lokiarchaeota archaeon]